MNTPPLSALIAAAKNAQAVLAEHWFGDYPDDPGGYNNEDIIGADERLQAALSALPTEPHVMVPRELVEEAAETITSLQNWVVDEATGRVGCKESRAIAAALRACIDGEGK